MNLKAINSATKYPSIPTFHKMGAMGRLLNELTDPDLPDELIVTEKIDGTNARIIILPDGDYIIGSREELLTYKGDRIYNPALGIVEAIKEIAEDLSWKTSLSGSQLAVYYGEVYGHKIGSSAKSYTNSSGTGFRLFDIATMPMDLLAKFAPEQIAQWRDSGGQNFLTTYQLIAETERVNLNMVPFLGTMRLKDIASSHEAVLDYLKSILPETKASLDGTGGQAEGIVVRTADRSKIFKLRFQDYKRSVK